MDFILAVGLTVVIVVVLTATVGVMIDRAAR
jgi:hypothetical protein